MFNATKGCKVITLFRNGEPVFYPPKPPFNGVHTIHVASIDEQFNNATMRLIGGDNNGNLLNYTEFKVYTVGEFQVAKPLQHTHDSTYSCGGGCDLVSCGVYWCLYNIIHNLWYNACYVK